MFLNPLDRILKQVTQQPEWSRYREYQQIKKCWQQVVNNKTFINTRLFGVERNTLYVATSNKEKNKFLKKQIAKYLYNSIQ